MSTIFCDLFDEEKARQESQSLASVSLDMWGACNLDNLLSNIERTTRQKPLHVELLRQVVDVCSTAGVEAFVYAGTALGVFRENGHMLPHDYDADLATLEHPDEASQGSLSKLAEFCLSRDIAVSGIEGHIEKPESSNISVNFSNSFDNFQWLNIRNGQVLERPFQGNGGKRAKFNFTHKGLRHAVLQSNQLESNEIDALERDLSNIHVDLFTLSSHPDSPEVNFRVNWQKAGVYESLEKPFARRDIFPLKKSVFEGIPILAPANLAGYLNAEYGYLGRDAMYDSSQKKYVQMPHELLERLPETHRKYIYEDNYFKKSAGFY